MLLFLFHIVLAERIQINDSTLENGLKIPMWCSVLPQPTAT